MKTSKAVIMAGGLGTRFQSISKTIPKCMVNVGGKTVLEHQLDCLKRSGITGVVLTVGHLADVIIDAFGNGSDVSVNISYVREEMPLGTAGGLYHLKDALTDDFLLINGDIIFDCNLTRLIDFHKQKNAIITLFAHPSDHPQDSVLLETDECDRVTGFLFKEDKRPEYYKNLSNAGIHVLSPRALEYFRRFDHPVKMDLDRELINHYIEIRRVYAYTSPEYVKDIGTPERLRQVAADFNAGKISERNL